MSVARTDNLCIGVLLVRKHSIVSMSFISTINRQESVFIQFSTRITTILSYVGIYGGSISILYTMRPDWNRAEANRQLY